MERERERKECNFLVQVEREREMGVISLFTWREREMDGWMDGLLYNQWIDHNNIVGER